MNRSELISEVAERSGLTKKQAGDAVEAVLGAVSDAMVRGDDVSIVGFGRMCTRVRPARKARDPKSGKVIDVPEKRVVAFKPGKPLRDRVNE